MQRVNEEQRAKRVELLATGTDDHRPDILVVNTGFEGVSKPVQTRFDAASYRHPELDEDDLFGPEEPAESAERFLFEVANVLGFGSLRRMSVGLRPRL